MLRLCTFIALAALTVACGDSDHKEASASTEHTASGSVPGNRAAKKGPIDLAPPLSLGMEVRDVRPPLTAGCTAYHYAERLSPQHLVLRCMVSPVTTPPGRVRRFIELGFFEGVDRPPRLAYYVKEWHMPRHLGGIKWVSLLAALQRAHGVAPTSLSADQAVWEGPGRRGDDSRVRLQWEGNDADAVVRLTFRDLELSRKLH